MNQPIDLVTHGQLQLTPRAAAILADVIRRAMVNHRYRAEPPAVECHAAGR